MQSLWHSCREESDRQVILSPQFLYGAKVAVLQLTFISQLLAMDIKAGSMSTISVSHAHLCTKLSD